MHGAWAQRFAKIMARPAMAYAMVLLAVGLAFGVQLASQLLLDRPPRYLALFPALLFATLVAGGRGGLLALALSVALVWALWLPHDRSDPLWRDHHVMLGLYAVFGAATLAIARMLRLALLQGVAAEERFRAAQEGSLDPFVILDPIRKGGEIVDFRWTYANPAANQNAPHGLHSLVGHRLLELLPNETGRAIFQRAKRLLVEGGPDEVEVERMVDGRSRWVRSSGVRLKDGLAVAYRDVTAQRESAKALRDAEAAVRSSRDEFEHIANAAPVMIWMAGPDHKATWFNRRWLEFTGRTVEDELGHGWRSRIHPQDAQSNRASTAAAIRRRETFHLQFRMQRADGQYRWIEGVAAPRMGSDGEFLGYIGSCVDVHERLEAETALRVGEARIRSLVDSLPQILWSNRADGACDYLSPQWERYTGKDMAGHYGDGWLEVVHPEDRDDVRRAWAETVAGRLPFDMEYRLRRHDGVWRWFHGRATAFYADGLLQRWFGAASDITEIVEARRDLEERVAERTRELEASLEERARTEAALAQAQRLETVGRLTGGVAHDFNNLLTVVIGGLDMILRAPEDSARVKRLAEAALSAGRRGERLTRQLLAFSRRQELKLEVSDVRALIEQTEPLVRRAVGEAVELSVRCDAKVGASRLDAAQFEAAILNLVVNAADATPPGGRIEISAGLARLAAGEAPGVAAGTYVRVAVRDTGAGMAPEVLERVFEPFFTTKEVGKGTGLGLAQVYGFVTQCGGAVKIDSLVGAGTRVTLYLPAVDEVPAGPEAEPVPAYGRQAGGAKVLLVEDDAAVRAVVEGLLADLGCEVASAADGPAALRRLDREERFDLVISDIVMPGGMSGVELARATQAKRPDLPVVLTTGYAGALAGQSPADLGWPVLRKPFRTDELAAMLRQTLGAATAPAEL